MKRVVLSIIAVAAALVTVSCNKEQAFDSGDIAKVTYTVAGPQMVATKAMGTIGTEYTLTYEVRLLNGSTLGEKLTGTGLSGSVDVAHTAWPVTVQFDLARGKQYQILFWAQSKTAPAGLFDASNLTAIAIDYTKMAANKEECDAFFGSDVITPSGATAASATLHRPFALVNLGTSDAEQFKTASGNAEVGNVKVTVTGSLANSFNVATATAGAGVETSFASTAAKIDAYNAKTLTVNEADFNYLSAVYVLPPAGEGIVNVAYEIKDNAANAITNLTVTNVPVKTNYRTNITGKLLTGSTTYNISVDQAFAGNTNKVVGPTFASVGALNDYFETMADNSDNGDINPEEVTLTAIADGETIILPEIEGDVVIRIPATLNPGTLSIIYPENAAKKPANLSLYVTELEILVADITSTHFTLLSGSHITNTANVQTSATTFVIQKGAKVGTVNIQKGNANIAGEVTTVSVPTGATADGTEPVQVFLAKQSAVDKIVLNAKTDVVVEQPKDHIEVDATERKVAVYIEEGADNSTAKAQNGGVIYVKAKVPCSVTADGTSEAESEDGNVSSTVIIENGAAGSSVVATNGAEIDLTANGNCTVSSQGTSDDQTPVPSTVNITGATTGTEINTNTANGGEINNPDNIPTKSYVAKIGETEYESLAAAFAAVPDNIETEIKLQNHYIIYGNDGIAIGANKNIILDLNGWLLSNEVDENRTSQIFAINGGRFTLRDSKGNGEMFNDVKKGTDPGEWWPGQHESPTNYVTCVINNFGTFILESGKIRQTAAGSICYAVDNNSGSHDAETILRGGIMTSNGTTMRMFCNSTTNENKLTIPENSTALVEGNYTALWIQLPSSNASLMQKGSLDIKGGTLKGNTYAFYDYSYGAGWDNVNYDISGGKFIGYLFTYKNNKTYRFVSGGTFTQSPKKYIVPNYTSIIEDGNYVIVPADIYYYWTTDNGYSGGYYLLSQPFENQYLCNGEFIDLIKDVTLTADIECQITNDLPVGSSFSMTFGNYTITKGNYSIILPTGISVITDKQTDIFTAADINAQIVETSGDNTYTYTATTVAE